MKIRKHPISWCIFCYTFVLSVELNRVSIVKLLKFSYI